jgi:hypothetical protein
MNVVRFREVIACIIAACSVYACATGSTSPSGGGGGEGGDSWGGPATGSSSSASGSSGSGSGSSGSSSGGTVCDTTSADCTACVTCSRDPADGLCASQWDACLNDFDCYDFLTCLQACPSGDTVCTGNCESVYAAGVPLFDVYASCVICQDCFVKCDGAGACM